MTRVPAYEESPYRTRLEVEIVHVGVAEGRPYAVLDDTLLFPEGGGQPADHGRLGEIAVLDVQKVDGEIRHALESPAALGPTALTLDWQRRYDHMQQHTAQHLLSALALTRFGWATRSFHLGAEVSDVELDAAELSPSDLSSLEEALAAEISAARPITTRRVSPEEFAELVVRSRGLPEGHRGAIRLVEIEGIDCNTCGGTHLQSTSEIGSLKLLDTERLRGGTRVRWVAGGRVRSRLAAHEARTAQLRNLFGADDASLAEIAGQKLEQLNTSNRRIRQLESELATARAQELAAGEASVASAHFDDADGGFLQQCARAFLERAPAKACLLTATSDKGSFFLVATGKDAALDAGELGPRIAEILDGRGGGSGSVFQGKAGSLAHRDQAESMLRGAAAPPRQ